MKLWIVIYAFGKIAGTIGPLPYGVDDCRQRATEQTQQFVTAARAYHGAPRVLYDRPVDEHTFVFACEAHDVEPRIQYDGEIITETKP